MFTDSFRGDDIIIQVINSLLSHPSEMIRTPLKIFMICLAFILIFFR